MDDPPTPPAPSADALRDVQALVERWGETVDAWEAFRALDMPPSATRLRVHLVDLMEKLKPVVGAAVASLAATASGESQ